MITFDCETKDPSLEEMGPGVYRKDGYVLGVAVKREGQEGHYYPLRHPETTGEERQKSVGALREILGTEEDKLAANSQYDLDCWRTSKV